MTEPESAAQWYVDQVLASLNACQNYLNKVERVVSSDTHERSRHHRNLELTIDRLLAWLNSGNTDQATEWRKVARLERESAYLIGIAAVWLANQNPKKGPAK